MTAAAIRAHRRKPPFQVRSRWHPSPCSPDSYNYCYVLAASGNTSNRCDTGVKNPQGQELYVYGKLWQYQIFKAQAMLELQETAVKTTSYTFNGSTCVMKTSWSPNEPKIYYGDPNLP